jgi:hypothetical protein
MLLDVIQQSRDLAAVDFFVRLLSDPDADAVETAIAALRDSNARPALGRLAQLARSHWDGGVRRAAAEAHAILEGVDAGTGAFVGPGGQSPSRASDRRGVSDRGFGRWALDSLARAADGTWSRKRLASSSGSEAVGVFNEPTGAVDLLFVDHGMPVPAAGTPTCPSHVRDAPYVLLQVDESEAIRVRE